MQKEILIATNNAGKYNEIKELLATYGVVTVSPMDLNINIEVEETGITLGENAKLKVRAYQKLAPDRLVLSDDRGLEIYALNNEPGIFVRRWKDNKNHMSDEEIISYCLERMAEVKDGERGARFRSVTALSIPNQGIELFEGMIEGKILEKPEPYRIKGLPFDCLFYVTQTGSMLNKSAESHWSRAILGAIPRIRELLA